MSSVLGSVGTVGVVGISSTEVSVTMTGLVLSVFEVPQESKIIDIRKTIIVTSYFLNITLFFKVNDYSFT